MGVLANSATMACVRAGTSTVPDVSFATTAAATEAGSASTFFASAATAAVLPVRWLYASRVVTAGFVYPQTASAILLMSSGVTTSSFPPAAIHGTSTLSNCLIRSGPGQERG